MTVPFYYASTARNFKDFLKYGLHPLSYLVALMATKNPRKASIVAGVATAGFYSATTQLFAGMESSAFDNICQDAVRAELGMRKDEFKYSDYLDSKNSIVDHYLDQWRKTYSLRTKTDLLPLMPMAMDYLSTAIPGIPPNVSPLRGKVAPDAPVIEQAINGVGIYDHAAYAAKSAYWIYETYAIPKSGFYEVYKIMENKEEVKRMITADDLIGVFNRTRKDRGEPMLDEKIERNAIWPVLEKMAQKMNETEHFGIEEMVYLIGLDKINIFAHDEQGKELEDEYGHRMISRSAYKRAMDTIDHVAEVGLKGITEENRAKRLEREKGEMPKEDSFVKRLDKKWLNAQFSAGHWMFGKPKSYTEHISPRDMGEVPSYVP